MIRNWKRNAKRKVPFIILAIAAGFAAFSGIVMLLWNNILPGVLHTGIITFWQAAGILLLARLLFGGLKGRRHRMAGGCGGRHHIQSWRQDEKCEPRMAGNE